MPKICYQDKNFTTAHWAVIDQANAIIDDWVAQGYGLTLRQLYYQFVANDIIPNTEQSYKRLGSIISDARMAGLIDWSNLTDRTRGAAVPGHWTHPAAIMRAAVEQFHLDYWKGQPVYMEVWVEKEALIDIVSRAADDRDIASQACRGYMSASTEWESARRLLRQIKAGKRVVILHLGDHDPSGVDMTRDNRERLANFLAHDLDDLDTEYDGGRGVEALSAYGDILHDVICEEYGQDIHSDLFEFRRIALNMDQIRQYNPPPNPAKLTDARATGYISEFGYQSWELDALPPNVLRQLIVDHIDGELDMDLYRQRVTREQELIDEARHILDEAGYTDEEE